MHNKKQGSEKDFRRSSNQQNFAAQDNKRRFQDPEYDRYFPEQNSYHPRNEDSQFQRWNEYPNQRNSNRSDLANQTFEPSSFGQSSSQSWSQPVRNDEAPQSTHSFYGKGPKNFKRSDDRIREEVSEALFHDHAVDASEIEVQVNDGEVTLSGTVSERRMKRLAEDCVERVSGVKDVRNEIRIQMSSFADRSEKTGSLPNTDNSGSSERLSNLSDKSKSKDPNKLM